MVVEIYKPLNATDVNIMLQKYVDSICKILQYGSDGKVRVSFKDGFTTWVPRADLQNAIIPDDDEEKKRSQKKILVLSGVGDSYWCMTKMESLMRIDGFSRPLVYTWEDIGYALVKGRPRTTGFLSRFPFIEPAGGEWNLPKTEENLGVTFGPPMRPDGIPKWLLRDTCGYDYIMNLNGVMEAGYTLDDPIFDLADYPTNWWPPTVVTQEEIDSEIQYKKEYGRYIVCHFSNTIGVYDTFIYSKVSFEYLYKMILDIRNVTKADKVILVGVTWDEGSTNAIASYDTNDIIVNLLHKTSIAQLFGLIKGSIGVFGTHSGCTMMPVMCKKPSIMIYPKDFPSWNSVFVKHILPPETYGTLYFPTYIEDLVIDYKDILQVAEGVFK
jgi:hypothetical protein